MFFKTSKTLAPRYIESYEIQPWRTQIGDIFIGSESIRLEHYHGVVHEVITNDCYDVQSLKEKGLEPKTIVDIGGHVGSFTCYAAHTWPEAKIYTLEVMKDDHLCGPFARAIARSLDANTSGLPNVTVLHKALLGQYGNLHADVVYGHDFEKPHLVLEDSIRSNTHRWAEATSVADFIDSQNITSIDFLKIDVEGSEINIFRELVAMGWMKNINEIRGEWHFSIARAELERLLTPTHHLDITWTKPSENWNLFKATRRT